MRRLIRRLCVRVFLVTSLVIFFLLIKDARIWGSAWRQFSHKKSFSPSLDYPVPGQRNFFFVETSCVLSDAPSNDFVSSSGLVLTPRMACALEAAASAHPNRPVYFVHTCPVDLQDLLEGKVPDFVRAVFSLPNVFLWPVRYSALFFGSPFEKLVTGGALSESKWPALHGSEVLRYFLLWRYGGTYLDTDFLALKSFGDLRDFTSVESASQISAGAVDISWEAPGRLLAEACLNETLRFEPSSQTANGPGAITRALRSVCGVLNVSEMNSERCHGFRLLPPEDFYPVPRDKWRRIFDEADAENTMQDIASSFAVNVWSTQSEEVSVRTSSRQVFAQVVRRVCPAVISSVGRYI